MRVKENSLPLPTLEQIKKFEDYYEINLPEDYKSFITQYNGAELITNVLPHNNEQYFIQRFLPWLDDPNKYDYLDDYDIDVVITRLDERLVENDDEIGHSLIPFALLVNGNYLCMDFRKNNNPTIVIWDDFLSEENQPITEYVCENFKTFLNILIE